MSETVSLVRALIRTATIMISAPLAVMAVLGAIHFPFETGGPVDVSADEITADSQEFYEEIYSPVSDTKSEPTDDHKYVQIGQEANSEKGIVEAVTEFIDRYGLHNGRVLEVGAGSGQLQDIVDDYTGLDIAASAKRYFHKPFVAGSATDLPFADNEFDALWTVWTLEHVPNPELALQEARRVVKPGGYLFLAPAWLCNSWAAEGYQVRPYEDFDLAGKLAKASLAIRANAYYRSAGLVSSRLARRLVFPAGSPTRLRYTAIDANFDEYWVADSDAVNSLDPHEVMLWHTSRGDECLNCPDEVGDQLLMGQLALEIRVNKGESFAD